MLHSRDGVSQVMSSACFCLEFSPRCLVSSDQIHRFCFIKSLNLQERCYIRFSEDWLPTGHSTRKAWLVECVSCGWPSGWFSYLHKGFQELHLGDYWVTFLPWLLVEWPDLGSVLVVLLHPNNGDHSAFQDHQCCRFFVSFPTFVAWHRSLDFIAWFLHWYALSAVKPYTDKCVPFQFRVNQLNLPQMDNQVVEISDGRSAKGVNMRLNVYNF